MSIVKKELKLSLVPPTYFTEEMKRELSKLRIIQKNLVHFQGFPDSMADKDLLIQKEYFGQFGKIQKIVLSTKEDEITKNKTNSAYITFSTKEEAAYSILATDSFMIQGHLMRSFFGTSKYCIHFLSNNECYNKEKCMFLHKLADEKDILNITSKFGYNEHIKIAKEIIGYSTKRTKLFVKNLTIHFPTVLPSIKSIYDNECKNNRFEMLENVSTKSTNSSCSPKNKGENSYGINENNLRSSQNANANCGKRCSIFKHKKQSRFYNCCNKGINENDGVTVPCQLIDFIDDLFASMSFSKKIENPDFNINNYINNKYKSCTCSVDLIINSSFY